jgi:uncharacterized protein YcaQ
VDHDRVVELVLKELKHLCPMMHKVFEFHARREEWKGSWYGPSVTKQVLRALWYSGMIMTTDRRKGQHVYDLTERVVPRELFELPQASAEAASRELVLDRHLAMGLVRPTAPPEIWSYMAFAYSKKQHVAALVDRGLLVPVMLEGQRMHAAPSFLNLLDLPALPPEVSFVAPLDQLMWDRKMVAHIFGFDYIWEIYTPEVKRRWGYYVLPVRFGDELVARVEFWARNGVLEIRRWHYDGEPRSGFLPALEAALRRFMAYSSTSVVACDSSVPEEIQEIAAICSSA